MHSYHIDSIMPTCKLNWLIPVFVALFTEFTRKPKKVLQHLFELNICLGETIIHTYITKSMISMINWSTATPSSIVIRREFTYLTPTLTRHRSKIMYKGRCTIDMDFIVYASGFCCNIALQFAITKNLFILSSNCWKINDDIKWVFLFLRNPSESVQ